MTSDEIKGLLTQLSSAMNNGDAIAFKHIIAPDFVSHGYNVPQGAEGFYTFIDELRKALEGFHIEIKDMIAEGDKVASRGIVRGKHTGKFLTIEPTGKDVEFSYLDIWRAENGRFVENWQLLDTLSIIESLETVI